MFSFIIPCYGNFHALEKTLIGFMNQKISREIQYEILLVDNNSEQPIHALYKKYYDKLPLMIILQPRLAHTFSLCKARNIGLKIAHYDIVVCIDSDCIINENYIASLISYSSTIHSLIITGERVFIDIDNITAKQLSNDFSCLNNSQSIKSASNYFLSKDRRFPHLYSLNSTQHPWAFMHGGNLIFSKEQALAINGFNEDYDGHWGYEDVEFAYRMITAFNLEPTYNESLYCYHQEEANNELCSDRLNKKDNPNWRLICQKIPGFEAFKRNQYTSFDNDIQL